MLRASISWIFWAGIALSACESDLGPCDESAARAVYFDSLGTPYYAGQAQVAAYCTNGCHSANAERGARVGAPAGLDFDVPVAGSDAEALSHLRAGQMNIFEWRHEAYEWAEAQTMPPEGFIRSGASFTDVSGAALPGLDQREGQEALRNWLSCGVPVIERSTPPMGAQSPGDLCAAGEVGDCRVSKGSGGLESTWTSIYDSYLGKSTCLACHETSAQATAFGTTFVMGDNATTAYDAMVGVMTNAAGVCAGDTIVVSGDADASNLVHKLEGQMPDGSSICGSPMPFGGRGPSSAIIQAVRAWIDAGALNN